MCVMNVRSVIRLRRVSSYSASICGVVSTTRQPGNWSTPLLPGAQPTPCFQSSTSPVGLAVRNLFSRMQPPRPLLENSTPVLSTTVGLPATRSLTLISATVESKRRDGLWGDSLQQSGPTNWNHPLGRMSTEPLSPNLNGEKPLKISWIYNDSWFEMTSIPSIVWTVKPFQHWLFWQH